jgi:AcrR family transcriptional regulator
MSGFLPACGLRHNVYTDNMPTDDNRVNIGPQASSYHHGDLRAALIEEGLVQIGHRPSEKVSLREIARKVGVSPTAVYRHFPNKAALLGALCAVGSERLTQTFGAAIRDTPEGMDAFETMGRTYVRFALDNPSLFRLMMTKALRPDVLDTDQDGRVGAFAMLANTLDSVLPKDLPPKARMVKRLQAWSIVHGLSMLILDGQIPPDENMIAAVVSRSFL